MKRFLSASLLSIVSIITYAADETPAAVKGEPAAVEEFKAITQQEMTACAAASFTVVHQGSEMEIVAAYQPIKACILAGHEKVRNAFPDALKQVSNNAPATALLKEFYSTWMASFDNVGQNGRETRAQYEKRSADERVKYEAIWKRFKKAAAKKH